jgi:hypothetical protein
MGGGAAATTKPAAAGNVEGQEAEGLKRLIQQKMQEQGLDSNVARPPASPSVRQPSRPAALSPKRVQLSKEAVPTNGPAGNRAPETQPAKGCSAGGKVQVDLTPPPPDQPQPRWSVVQDTIEVPPLWKGSKAEFVFQVRNAGEGPLNIQLKGG